MLSSTCVTCPRVLTSYCSGFPFVKQNNNKKKQLFLFVLESRSIYCTHSRLFCKIKSLFLYMISLISEMFEVLIDGEF